MNKFKVNNALRFAVLTWVILLTSCSAVNSKVGGMLDLDTDVNLTFIVNDNVNPDDNKVPSPVILRMYELKSTKAFENANFIDLYERDTEVLGKTMLNKQSVRAIQPGENRTEKFILSKEAKYIGLYAEFLQYENSKYKVIIPIDVTNLVTSSGKIKLSENKMVSLK